MTISGNSKLILNEMIQINFIENHALRYGGAIYFEDTVSVTLCSNDIIRYKDCFIEISSTVNVQLNFSHDTAIESGSVLYGGDLDMCNLLIGKIRDSCGRDVQHGYFAKDPIDMIKNISYITSDMNEMPEISSAPHQVCLCENNNFNCTKTINKIITMPGKLVKIYAVIVGQAEDIISNASVRVTLNNGILIKASEHIQQTRKECTQLTYHLFSSYKHATLILYPDDSPCRDAGISRTEIHINFLPCPNGFILCNKTRECVCDKRLSLFTTKCNVDTVSIHRKSNTFWMGALYNNDSFEGLILHSGCPFDFCVDTPVNIKLDNLDIQCSYNHSGTLCGSCKHNHSVAFGTLHCIPCDSDYLALTLLFALAGILLVALLLLLNMTVANVTIHGLIFYANIVQANRSTFFHSKHSDTLMVFIAWINLDLGIETCFYNGMTTYVFTWLQFLFPFYVWFLIALMIVVSQLSDRIAKSLGSNPVAALATLLLLSYSKIPCTIITIFSVAILNYPDGTNKLVWLYDGNVPYFQRSDHIVLGTFAILILLFLFLPYTLLLLCGHWLQAFSHKWMFSWLNKIKPFMDAYHAPYKKRTRFWVGLLVLARCIIFLVTALNTLGNNKLTLLIIISITGFLATLAWVHHRIYEKFHNDLLEAFFILNLYILAAGTYHIENSGTGSNQNQARLTYTSVGIAFATFICVLIYHVYLRLLKISALKAISDTIKGVWTNCRKKTNTEDNLESAGPTTSSVKLLESLLESK